MSGKRLAGVTDAFDVRLLGLGAELPGLRPELLGSPFALADLLLYGTDQPVILVVQLRPR